MTKRKKTILWVTLAAVAIAAVAIFDGIYNARKDKTVKTEQFIMDTIITQTVVSSHGQEVADTVNEQLRRFEEKLSMHLDDSEISKINANAGVDYVKVSQETFDLISTAKSMSELSGGLFDVTIAPLTSLWGITSDHPRVPSQEEIDQAKSLVNYEDILLDEENTAVMLRRKGQALDMGGIAKGMATDMVREIYEEMGVTAASISLGGNVLVIDPKSQGEDFVIGLRDPRGTANDVIAKLVVEGKVIATTGDYERYFEQDGKRYHHVIDPRTGYPCETDLIQATAICENGMLADFLSTTLFMMGKDKVLAYADNDMFDFIIVDKDKNVYASQGILASIRQIDENTGYTFYEGVAVER